MGGTFPGIFGPGNVIVEDLDDDPTQSRSLPDFDVMVVDTTSDTVSGHFKAVGTTLFGIDMTGYGGFYFCAIALIITFFISVRIFRSPFGLKLRAIRSNQNRINYTGINPRPYLLVAFVISGAITGLAGALFADLNRFVSPTMFSWQTSGEIIVFVIIGGVARLFGPVAGAVVFVALEHVLGGLSNYWHIYLGLLLLGIVLFGRGGLIGMLTRREPAHD